MNVVIKSITIHITCVVAGTIPIFLILLFTRWTHEKLGHDSPFITTGFFFFFVLFMQFVIVRPTTDQWKKKNARIKDKLILFGAALSIVAGFNFGIAFGDILNNFVRGTVIFGLFYLTNLFAYSRLTGK